MNGVPAERGGRFDGGIMEENQRLTGQSFTEQMDCLYEQATIADASLGRFMRELNAQFQGVIVHPPLKKRETAEEKLSRGGGERDDPATLRDIARATIKYNRLETMYAARDTIRTRYGHLVVKVKDRYQEAKAVPSGYRDVKFFIKMDAGDHGQHICELQLNVSTALVAKEREHPVYEILRRGDKTGGAVLIPAGEAQKLGPKLRTVFIMCKKAGLLTPDEKTALLSVVLAFFQDRAASRLKPGAVSLQSGDVQALQKVTPKLYQHYEQQALKAKYMTASGFQTQMSQSQLAAFT